MKSKKSALLLSFTSLLICFAMLVGSTFAWFTDTATTGVNKIQAGNLDILLATWNTNTNKYDSVEGQTMQFVAKDGRTDIFWEPGCTYELPELFASNQGNLALKCKFAVNGFKGDLKLLDALEFSVKYRAWNIDPDTGSVDIDFSHQYGENEPLDEFTTHEFRLPPANDRHDYFIAFTISAHMKEEAGNEYQNLSLDGIGITVVATQYTYEKDSISDQYDKDATYPEVEADKLAETLPTLADNAVITVNGTVNDALTISKPVTIHNLTATAPVTIASDGVTLNAANIEYKAAKTPALVANSGVKDVTITNSVITAETGDKGSHTAVSLPVSGKVVFTGNTVTNNYNGVEFGQDKTELLGDGSVIANNTFKNIGNNAISIYRVAEGATVTIENNVFEKVSNAIRLSNYAESTTATFEIKNNTVDIVNSWGNVFVLLQDTNNNDFSKYTLNFSDNTFNGETVNYYKVYSDATKGFVDNNNPVVKY